MEDGGQMPEDGGRKQDARSQMPEDREQNVALISHLPPTVYGRV